MAAETAFTPPLPPPQRPGVDVLVLAGEHSGDEQAARMVETLLGREPGLNVVAIGGARLAAAGAQLLFELTASSVVGLVEVLRNYGFFRRVFREVVRWIDEHRPRVVCFVDYPGFNLRLAAELHARGISCKGGGPVRTVFYIGPQIWAWKARRRFAMAETLDGLAVVFPFEVACYHDTDLPVRFVGHPFLGERFVPPLSWSPEAPVLLLPGSRRAAVGRIAPVLLDAFTLFRRSRPGATAVMIHPGDPVRGILERELAARPGLEGAVRLEPNDRPTAGAAVLTSSGTMSLLCALAAIPGAIAYRANPVTYRLGRMLVRIPFLGMANILLERPMYPEFIQGEARPGALAVELADCLGNPSRIGRTKALAAELRARLARPPDGDAADWLLERIRG